MNQKIITLAVVYLCFFGFPQQTHAQYFDDQLVPNSSGTYYDDAASRDSGTYYDDPSSINPSGGVGTYYDDQLTLSGAGSGTYYDDAYSQSHGTYYDDQWAFEGATTGTYYDDQYGPQTGTYYDDQLAFGGMGSGTYFDDQPTTPNGTYFDDQYTPRNGTYYDDQMFFGGTQSGIYYDDQLISDSTHDNISYYGGNSSVDHSCYGGCGNSYAIFNQFNPTNSGAIWYPPMESYGLASYRSYSELYMQAQSSASQFYGSIGPMYTVPFAAAPLYAPSMYGSHGQTFASATLSVGSSPPWSIAAPAPSYAVAPIYAPPYQPSPITYSYPPIALSVPVAQAPWCSMTIRIQKDGAAQLTWSSQNASYGIVSHGIGRVAPSGSTWVYPQMNDRYTLVMYGQNGQTSSCEVVVTPSTKHWWNGWLI